MTTTPNPTTPPVPDPLFGRAVLDIAAEVEADEQRLKRKMLTCARIYECDRLVEMLDDWLHRPASEVLAKHADIGLDPCPPPEVTPPVPLEE